MLFLSVSLSACALALHLGFCNRFRQPPERPSRASTLLRAAVRWRRLPDCPPSDADSVRARDAGYVSAAPWQGLASGWT